MVNSIVPSTSTELRQVSRKRKIDTVTSEGTHPSLKDIDRWFQNNLPIKILYEGKQIEGKIRKIGPYRTKDDALVWINGQRFGFFARKIDHFKVEGEDPRLVSTLITPDSDKVEKDGPSFVPLLITPDSDPTGKFKTVTVITEEVPFILNQEKLAKEVPYFELELKKCFKKGKQNEIDVTNTFTPEQIKLLIFYLEGSVPIDASSAFDLFILSSISLMEELHQLSKDFLLTHKELNS